MQTYKCLDCGANLVWNVKTEDLTCDFCGRKHTLADFGDMSTTDDEVKEESIKEEDLTYKGVELEDGMVAYECKGCAGTIVTLKTTMAEVCPYCGETMSITSKSVGEFRPKYVVPFNIDKEKAIDAYRAYAKSSRFAPAQFSSDNIIDKLQGLYTPYYLHSMNDRTHHSYTGEKKTVRHRGDVEITEHKVYSLKSQMQCDFVDVPLDASKRIPDYITRAQQFDCTGKKEYNPIYMSGFVAEQADDDKDAIFAKAESICKSAMDRKSKELFKAYEDVSLESVQHNVTNHTSDYCMLPLWIFSTKFNNKVYTYAVNGQNGKISGALPVDWKKTAIWVLSRSLIAWVIAGALVGFGGL